MLASKGAVAGRRAPIATIKRHQTGLELLAALEATGAATPVSLDLPEDLTFRRYEAVGVALGRAHRNVAWKIGDWINFGEHRYKHKYAQAVELTNLRYETLMNYASIARRVPRERRRVELPFSAHAEVTKLSPQEQTAWLERAVQNEWKREELRAHIRPQENLTPALGEVVLPDLEEAARALVASAKLYGSDYLVLRHRFIDLCVALGEEV